MYVYTYIRLSLTLDVKTGYKGNTWLLNPGTNSQSEGYTLGNGLLWL